MAEPYRPSPSAIYTAAFWGLVGIVLICLWCRAGKVVNAFLLAAITCRLEEFFQQRREEQIRRDTHERVARAQAQQDKSIQPTPREVVAALPEMTYTAKAEAEADDDMCVICWSEYIAGDTLTVLPCKHNYHKACISDWLQRQHRCPICNGSLLPQADAVNAEGAGEDSTSHVINVQPPAGEHVQQHHAAEAAVQAHTAPGSMPPQAGSVPTLAAGSAVGLPVVSAAAFAAGSGAVGPSVAAAPQQHLGVAPAR